MNNTNKLTVSTVTIPGVSMIPEHVRYEARIGSITSGLCTSTQEAVERAQALAATGGDWEAAGLNEAPDMQANHEEMAYAAAWVAAHPARDGGVCARVFAAAKRDGIHSVSWAQASAYIGEGHVPYHD